VAALAGLTPTPYESGNRLREQGISKAGNRRVRTLAIEIAWAWLRYQPRSKLSRWFLERFAAGGSRMRRIGIVALARRLLIDLWRFLEHGVSRKVRRLNRWQFKEWGVLEFWLVKSPESSCWAIWVTVTIDGALQQSLP
jgi:hypothetical protein